MADFIRYSWQEAIIKEVKQLTNRQLLDRVIDLAASTDTNDDRIVWDFNHSEGALKERLSDWIATDERRGGDSNEPTGMWEGTPPQVVTVPFYAKRLDRDKHTEECDQCLAYLIQDLDICPECGRPVKWEGSAIADDRYKRQKAKDADLAAKNKREQQVRLSETTAYVLAIAKASSIGTKCDYAKGEEEAIFNYEKAYGSNMVKARADDLRVNANLKGRGLIVTLLNALERYNPTGTYTYQAKHNNLTDLLGNE